MNSENVLSIGLSMHMGRMQRYARSRTINSAPLAPPDTFPVHGLNTRNGLTAPGRIDCAILPRVQRLRTKRTDL